MQKRSLYAILISKDVLAAYKGREGMFMSENLMLYKYFVAAAEERSITSAAKKLYVSQPAVSAGIARLEDYLGTALFFRTNKGIALTAEGALLLDYIKKAFSFIEAGEDKLRELSGLREGVMRIGASDMTLKFVLFDYIKTFKSEHPGVRLIISNNPTPKTLAELRSGEIDICAISSPVPPSEDLEVIPVRSIRDIFVCAPGYPVRDTLTLEELSAERLIMLDRETSTRRYIDDMLSGGGRARITPDIELATSDLLIESAIRGFGISAVVEDFAREYIERGELREVKIEEEIPERELMIVYLRGIQLSAAAKEFIRIVTDKKSTK